ncbi:MAG: hypothetical protein ACI32N_08485 [Bulleidia sp.]
MSDIIRIRPGFLSRIRISNEQLIALSSLHYGTADSEGKLQYDTIGEHTILYNPDCICRGVEFQIHNDREVILTMNLPAASYDLEIFYDLIRRICGHFHVRSFLFNDQKADLSDIPALKKRSRNTSIAALANMKRKLKTEDTRLFRIFGALHPIDMGIREFEEIHDLDSFQHFLHAKQSDGTIWKVPEICFHKDGIHTFGVFRLREALPYALPDNTEGLYPLTNEFYIYAGYAIMRYRDVWNALKPDLVYDGARHVITLDAETIQSLSSRFAVDPETGERQNVPVYLSRRIIDRGEWHASKITEKNLPVKPINAYNHMATFMEWAKNNDILDPRLREHVPELFEGNDIRQILDTCPYMAKSILLGYFRPEYHSFILSFYAFNGHGYPDCVDQTMKKILPDYGCPQRQDEDYLFVTYNDHIRNLLYETISNAFTAWKENI